MPRLPNPAVRSQLLTAGLKLIQVQGFNGCGIKDITDEAHVPKGSFYNYFPSKDAFAIELLEEYWTTLEITYGPILLDKRREPLDRIAAYFRALSKEHQKRDFSLGCLIASLALELSPTSRDVRKKIVSLLDRWALMLVECLTEAQRSGSLEPKNVHELAAILIEAWEGAAIRGKVLRSAAPYRRFETFLLNRLLH